MSEGRRRGWDDMNVMNRSQYTLNGTNGIINTDTNTKTDTDTNIDINTVIEIETDLNSAPDFNTAHLCLILYNSYIACRVCLSYLDYSWSLCRKMCVCVGTVLC